MAVRITGHKDIARKLKQLGPKVARKIARRSMRESLKQTRDEAKRQVPVDTGQLKKAIKVKAAKRKKDYIGLEVVVDSKSFPDAFYGMFQEFGTSKMKPNAFLRRSYDITGNQVAKDMIEKLRDGILKEVG